MLVTVLRHKETGDEKTVYGNFSQIRAKKEGYEVVSSEMETYQMTDETFVKNATVKSK